MKKTIIKYVAFAVIMFATIVAGVVLFNDRQYAAVSAILMVAACMPYLLHFEHKSISASHISLVAVMTALSVVGRIVFAPIPFFKPVSAMVIITGIYMGADMGFVCGAASALVSNIYFGQGPWTPFQMFSWGCIGLVAGLLGRGLRNNNILLCIYGALSGIAYSFLMDVWSVMWADGGINISKYLTCITLALPVTAIYVVSNILFLLMLARPLGRKLAHAMKKW